MASLLLVASLGALVSFLLIWGMRSLSGERWQIIASVPIEKTGHLQWRGQNFTFYGIFLASGCAIGFALFLFLLASLHVPARMSLTLSLTLFAACLPAARVIARLVEGKAHTFTVGGASFLGILIAPWFVWILNRTLGFTLDMMVVLAALSIAYAFGEGIGRLGCISFGCCYGKPLYLCHPVLIRLFKRDSVVFSGETKKAAYEGNLTGERLAPIQGLTAALCSLAGLGGLALFLTGHYRSAFISVIAITQVWRVLSEFLRSDFRGGRAFSFYQDMAIAGLGYALVVALMLPPSPAGPANLLKGFAILWHPMTIIGIEVLWAIVFLYTGRSTVTGSNLTFHVVKENT